MKFKPKAESFWVGLAWPDPVPTLAFATDFQIGVGPVKIVNIPKGEDL